jgi:hypothetical protein
LNQPIEDILASVGVNHVEEDGDAQFVGLVHEALELFWGALD